MYICRFRGFLQYLNDRISYEEKCDNSKSTEIEEVFRDVVVKPS